MQVNRWFSRSNRFD